MVIVRDLAAMIHDHRKGLVESTAPNTPEALTLDVLGIPQLFWVYRYCRDCGIDVPVYDADDLLEDPARGMQTFCRQFGVHFTPEMVKWNEVDLDVPPWGDEWYEPLRESEGLQQPERVPQSLPDSLDALHSQAESYISRFKITSVR